MDSTIEKELDGINQLDIKEEPVEMTKKIAIDGIEISVADDQLDNLVDKLKEGVQIDDLEGWSSTIEQEPYDFNKFVEKATEYSEMKPPDIVQFSEKAWGAASICVIEFYLKHFDMLIQTHSAKSKLLNAICAGLTGEKASQLKDIWNMAQESHSNFYDMNFVRYDDRKFILESIKGMPKILEEAEAGMDRVNDKLSRLQLERSNPLTLKRIANPKFFKIGELSYKYNYIAR